jgi:predicted NBD/HSP70 family sugar kinase
MKPKLQKIDLTKFRVARSQTARDFNRRVVLNVVRRHQPISRAGVARRSGMQRSTISAITEELIEEKWLTEGAVGHLPRGRKPTFLHLNADRAGIIGVDLQPHVATLAVSTLDNRFVAQEQIATGADPEGFVARLARRINDLKHAYPKNPYEGIGVAVPGRVEPSSHRLIFAPNLGWTNFDLKTPLERETGLEVELENAANACALAEWWSGRYGDAVGNLLAVTVSDGIGVGMIVNGQLMKGANGSAGEFGHVALTADGPQCRCGNFGCWEVMGSNAAAVRYYAETSSANKDKVGSKSDLARVSFLDVVRLAEQGDEKALSAIKRMAFHLGTGFSMLITGLAPEILLVVGDVTRAWDRVEPIVNEVVQARCRTGAPTRIIASSPDAQLRLRGTIPLVLQKHFDTPFGVA